MGQSTVEPGPSRAGGEGGLASDLAAFHDDLIALRVAAGAPSYARIARLIGQPRTTVYDAFRRSSLPSLELLTALVTALKGDPARWRGRWAELRARVDAALPDDALAGASALDGAVAAVDPEPQPDGPRTSSDGVGLPRRGLWVAIVASVGAGAVVAAGITALVVGGGGDHGGCTHYRAYRISKAGALLAKNSAETGRVAAGDVVLVSSITDHTFRSRYPAIDVMTGRIGYVDEEKLDFLHDSCLGG
jgi:hypothetical protein